MINRHTTRNARRASKKPPRHHPEPTASTSASNESIPRVIQASNARPRADLANIARTCAIDLKQPKPLAIAQRIDSALAYRRFVR